MNKVFAIWIYLLLAISFVYWFSAIGMYAFPKVSPIIFSLIATAIVYYLSRYQTFVFMI
jgi:hypothetical protein